MAFRMGSFKGTGAVYSRRRGRAAPGKARVFRDAPSIIYEESEEDGELDVEIMVPNDEPTTIAPSTSRTFYIVLTKVLP
jgi:hypothetical protein